MNVIVSNVQRNVLSGLDIDIIKKLLKEGKLSVDNGYLKINPKYIYISNTILVNFIDLSF